MNAAEMAQGKWPGIISALIGAEIVTRKHQPCPMCGGKDRFRFTDFRGMGDWICNSCGSGNGFDLLQGVHGWDFAETAKRVEGLAGNVDPVVRRQADPLIRLRKIQAGLGPIGREVKRYLAGRGLIGKWGRIYEHPALRYYGDTSATYPAMAAKATDVNDRPVTYHLTYLQNGKKAPVESPKKIMTPNGKLMGSAVRLGRGERIAVTEGIETGMAVMNRTGLPTWAALSANGMKQLQIPDLVTHVSIYGDNDHSYTGQAAALDLAQRLHREGKVVEVYTPSQPGTDWADEWAN